MPTFERGLEMAVYIRKAVFLVGICVALGFLIGFLVGYFSVPTIHMPVVCEAGEYEKIYGDGTISERMMGEIDPQNIRQHLRNLTSRPHLTGTEGDTRVVNYINDFWVSIGLKPVKKFPYTVLVSSPDPKNPSRIGLFDGERNLLYSTQLFEKILRPEQNQSDVVPPFNVYSRPGIVEGKLVYVNYGKVDDFEFLKEKISLNGSICIARYGGLFRADKVVQAQRYGCAGLILYTDPADYAVAGVDSVYPNSWWLPGTGVQRGTLKKSSAGTGDPLTPLYPAIVSAYRIPESEADLPRIPVHPIGYDDAKVLLEGMTGDEVPEKWRGKLNITYRIGPGFTHPDRYIQMNITTRPYMATIQNVIGFIEGALEPDRYVLIGNHHDAWVFGAVDPSSGTAVMLELSRAFAKLVSEGWRPRRTIVFCAWGGEEQGIIGSREWVENFGHLLGDRAVAYLNVDSAVQGNFALRARALPMLKQVLYDVAKMVPNPDSEEQKKGRYTVYDTWSLRYPEKDETNQLTGKPRVPVLGSGSDFAPFIGKIGVTCVDLRFHFDESLRISSYPLYHSVYETFHLFETYIDPEFKFSAALGQFWGELARRLADYAILPMGVKDYGLAVEGNLRQFELRYGTLLSNNSISLDYLRVAVYNFSLACETFEERVSTADASNMLRVRRLNDQMMQLERSFIDPPGLPNRPSIRHVLFAPSMLDSYTGASFPSLTDSLFQIEKVSGNEKFERWEAVKQQLSIVTFFIEAASASLAKPTDF